MWFPLDSGFHRHRKTLKLRQVLRCPTAEAYASRLFAYCADEYKDGRPDPDLIESICEWRGKRGALVAALRTAGFLDEDGSVHNWSVRSGLELERIEAKRKADREAKAARIRAELEATSQDGRSEVVTTSERPRGEVGAQAQHKKDMDIDKEREEEEARASRGSPPEPPPPPASRNGSAPAAPESTRPPTAPAPAAPRPPGPDASPFVLKLAARSRATITPRGSAPHEPDESEVSDWRKILAREPESEWEPWWVPRLCELMGQIASSEKHGPGGSFVISGPWDLLKPSSKKDPKSKPILDEMLVKFPTKLETPEKRAARARHVWTEDRRADLQREKCAQVGRLRLTPAEIDAIERQLASEWLARAGPPPGRGAPEQQHAKEG